MEEKLNRPEPKKIKMPSLVDRSQMDDTMDWYDTKLEQLNENHNKNDSQSISELDSLQGN
jgi:hypothetical protein